MSRVQYRGSRNSAASVEHDVRLTVPCLAGRTQFVRCGSSESAPVTLLSDIPQGSVLGPILCLLYTANLWRLIEGHDLIPLLYAVYTQICGYSSPSDALQLQEKVSRCLADVAK